MKKNFESHCFTDIEAKQPPFIDTKFDGGATRHGCQPIAYRPMCRRDT